MSLKLLNMKSFVPAILMAGLSGLTTVGCQKQGDSEATEPSKNWPLHAPLALKEPPHNFYGGNVLNDGRIWGYGIFDATDSTRLFVTSADKKQAILPVTDGAEYQVYAEKTGHVFYLLNGALYGADATRATQLSGEENVQHFWLSPDQSKVAYIGNVKYALVYVQAEKRYIYLERNELYVVDVKTGTRAKMGPAVANAMVAYESNDYQDLPYLVRPQFLPDSSRIVFVLTRENVSLSELYSVGVDGKDLKLLSADLPFDAHNGDEQFLFSVSPSSRHVLYVTGEASNRALHTVTVEGTNDVIVSGSMVSGGGLQVGRYLFSASFSPDSQYAIFLADAEVAGDYHYYRTPVGGGDRVELTGGKRVQIRGVPPLFFQSNGDQMLFVADGLYRVAVSSGQITELNATDKSGEIGGLVLTSRKDAVVYIKYNSIKNNQELYATRLDGSRTVPLYVPTGDTTGFQFNRCASRSKSFVVDATSNQVAFCTDNLQGKAAAVVLVNLDGENLKIVTPEKIHSDSTNPIIFGFGGDRLIFAFDRTSWTFTELFEYDLNTNVLRNLSSEWPSFVTEDATMFQQSENGVAQIAVINGSAYRETAIVAMRKDPDSSCRINIGANDRVVGMYSNTFPSFDGAHFFYTIRSENGGAWQFYKASTADCGVTELDTRLAVEPARMKLTPDGKTIVYTGGSGGRTDGVYAVNLDNSQPRLLSQNVSTDRGVPSLNMGAFFVTPDSSRVIFWSDQQTKGNLELYSVGLDGKNEIKLNGGLQPGTGVYVDDAFQAPFSANSRWVLYFARQDNTFMELYASRVDGTARKRLTEGLVGVAAYSGNFSKSAEFSRDSRYVVFFAFDAAHTDSLEIYSVDMNGGGAKKLNPALAEGGTVIGYKEFTISPSTGRVMYLMRNSTTSPPELYTARLDGNGIAKLNAPLSVNREVTGFAFNSEETRAIYRVNDLDRGRVNYYSCLWDGSDQIDIANTPDYGWQESQNSSIVISKNNEIVVRMSDGDGDGLYKIPVAGGPRVLIAKVRTNSSVYFTLSPERDQLYVLGDLREKGVTEVFRFDL